MIKVLVSLLVCVAGALAQGNTARMDGTVTDPQGAAVPAAAVTVLIPSTGQTFSALTNENGECAIPSLGAATYRVSVSKPGFKVATADNVVMNAGVPATVHFKLEIGETTEVVEVDGGAEIVQATTASVSSTITGRQIFELPFASRNALELLVTQPGTQTPTNPRSSSINGLPKGALNITIDGMNSQDNLLKSSDGFFSYITPSVDALDEVTLTTSAFASPAAYTYGNTPRTGVFGRAGPSGYNADLSLRRIFDIHESMKLAFQADVINIFNFVNFGGPNLSITSAGFGKITSQANSPRVLQLSARFSF